MRLSIIILASVLLTGCAAHQEAVSTDQQLDQRTYAPGAAAALAFDPPVLAGSPRVDLSRDDRQPAAFAGYQDTTTTFYFVNWDDKQDANPQDARMDREVTSQSVGTSYR